MKKWRILQTFLLVFVISATGVFAQSMPLPTDRARVQVVSIPDAYNPAGPQLKVLRTDANTPLRAGTAWIWEKQGQEENEAYYTKLRANGLNTVRMILFDTWEVEAYPPSATFIPTDWNNINYRNRQLARMERAVNFASQHGMYVVINSHNKIPNYNAAYVDALWTHVAPYFANRTHVLYEAANEPMSGIGTNGNMDEPSGAMNSPRLQALKTTYNLIRNAAPNTHIMVLTPPGINDGAFGTGMGNLAESFAALPGEVDWTKTSVAYHLYGNDRGFGTTAVNAANLRNLHSRFPGWPSENAFPPGNFPGAVGLDQWRSIPFDNDQWVNQTCERLGIGWAMWFINGHTQFDTNFPIMMANASAQGWNWAPDPLTAAPSVSPAAGNITGPTSISLTSATPGTSIRYTLDGSQPTPSLGTLYTGTLIPISATTTLRAVAFGSGIPISSTSTFVYTLVVPVSSVRVNAGGPAVGAFAADGGFSTSIIQGQGASVSTAGVTKAAPASLYDTERWNTTAFTYTSPVLTAGRRYSVRMHFAERYVGAPNERRFNIGINGANSGPNYLENFDVFVAAGNSMNKAVVRDFTNVIPDGTGRIHVRFSLGSVQLPMINGIEVFAEPNGLDLFRVTHGLEADGSQDQATPASDRVGNLLKYAFNLIGPAAGQRTSIDSPVSTILSPATDYGLPAVMTDFSGKLQVTYVRRNIDSFSGIDYTVEFSSSLAPDSWQVNPTAGIVVTEIDSLLDRVTVTDDLTAAPRRFARVRVHVIGSH